MSIKYGKIKNKAVTGKKSKKEFSKLTTIREDTGFRKFDLRKQDATKRSRRSDSNFYSTPQWAILKAEIDAGFTPYLAVEVHCDPEELRNKYHIKERRTIPRSVQRYLEDHSRPYTVQCFNRDGRLYIRVQYVPVTAQMA